MFRNLSIAELIATVIVSCGIAAFSMVLILKLHIDPTYPDFIVGSLAWYAGTKFQDLLAAPVFVGVLLLSIRILTGLICEINKRVCQKDKDDFTDQILWWSIPLIVTIVGLISGQIIGQPMNETLIYVFATCLLALSVISGYDLWRGKRLSPLIVGMAIMGILFFALIPLEIALVLGRVSTKSVEEINIYTYVILSYYLTASGILVVMVLAFRLPERLCLWIPRLLLIGQVGLPLFFLTLFPARLVEPGGSVHEYMTTGWLKILLVGMLVWGVADVLWHYKKFYQAGTKEWTILFSPIAVFGLIVALGLGNTVTPQISPDDYHFGERLLGWWGYLHGKIPYVDYIPTHGLVDDWAGFLSLIFYDGTAATILEASRLGFALLALVAYLAVYRFLGGLGVAVVSILLLVKLGPHVQYHQWLVLVPFLIIWISKSLRARPAKWLAVWLLTVPVVILIAPPQGLLLAVASTIIAFRSAWLLWVRRERSWLWEIGSSLIILLVCALLIPLFPMLLGAIRYVFENGPINQVAYGLPWWLSWKAEGKLGLVVPLILEAIRMSWVAAPMVSLSLLLLNYKERARWELLSPAIVVILFTIFLIPYTMGRIDPGALSRPGLVAIFGWTVLIPVTAWPLIKPSNRTALVVLIALVGATLNYGSLYVLSFSSLVSAVSASTATGAIKDGKKVGLPNIGRGVVQDEQWDRLTRLNALLSKALPPGETYLDLTNHNAEYFYLNRQPSMAVTAPYNMVPLSQQQRAVADLSRNLPRLALLEANNILHDGGGLALRDPLLYRFVIDNYIPAWENGFVVGYRKQNGYSNEISSIHIPIKNLSDINWENGVHRREAAVLLSDATPLSAVSVGSQAMLGNGERRHITRIWAEGSAIWLDGAVLDPSKIGAPGFIKVSIDRKLESEFRLALLEKSFTTKELAEIPIAWGRSESSLIKRMELVGKIDQVSPSTHDMTLENGSYKIVGNDPQIIFDLSSAALSGHDTGLLRFEFLCLNQNAEPRIQVFWWGDEQTGPSEAASLKFTADDGVLIVPLDAYPRWLTLGKIQGVRIDLDNAAACGAIKVSNVALYQRKAVLR